MNRYAVRHVIDCPDDEEYFAIVGPNDEIMLRASSPKRLFRDLLSMAWTVIRSGKPAPLIIKMPLSR